MLLGLTELTRLSDSAWIAPTAVRMAGNARVLSVDRARGAKEKFSEKIGLPSSWSWSCCDRALGGSHELRGMLTAHSLLSLEST